MRAAPAVPCAMGRRKRTRAYTTRPTVGRILVLEKHSCLMKVECLGRTTTPEMICQGLRQYGTECHLPRAVYWIAPARRHG